MSTRQTLSFLRKRFDQAGIRPRTGQGQNFLIDLNLLDVLVRTADVGPRDVVLEVGTGTGSLTARLASRAAYVVTVELDLQLAQLARQQLENTDNVMLLETDALEGKNRLNPQVIRTVVQQMERHPEGQLKLIANLPYHIATPLIANLLDGTPTPDSMTVTIQKELADRIVARPGFKDYGSLSVWVQSQSQAHVFRILPPSVFWPRPKVHSAMIQIQLDPVRRAAIPDRAYFHQFVRALFVHRRKLLRGALYSMPSQRWDRNDVDAVLARVQLPADSRAEQLDVATILQLCETVRTWPHGVQNG